MGVWISGSAVLVACGGGENGEVDMGRKCDGGGGDGWGLPKGINTVVTLCFLLPSFPLLTHTALLQMTHMHAALILTKLTQCSYHILSLLMAYPTDDINLVKQRSVPAIRPY